MYVKTQFDTVVNLAYYSVKLPNVEKRVLEKYQKDLTHRSVLRLFNSNSQER